MKGFFLGGPKGEGCIPFSKGSENPLAGRNFYGGARGRFPYVRSPRFQRGEYGPAERKALSSALVGLTPSLNLVPPRPLQATPTPSSGMLKGASRPPPQLAPPEKSGLIKAGMVSPIGGIMFAALAGLSGEAPRRGRRAPAAAV